MTRLPLWFRLALLSLCVGLAVPFVLIKTSVGQDAIAYATRSIDESVRPLLLADAVLPSFALPADGSYVINGMPVEYHTYGTRESAEAVSRKFRAGFEKSGYKHGVFDVQGSPTLVAVHPETMIMITVRLVRDRAGTPGMRLTQQDLSKLDPEFDARIAEVPTYPGATHRVLVSSIEGKSSRSLSFQAPGSPEMIEQFYREHLGAEGWQRFDSPVELPTGNPVSLFFERDGLESSVLIVPQEGSTRTFVMVTLTGDPADLS